MFPHHDISKSPRESSVTSLSHYNTDCTVRGMLVTLLHSVLPLTPTGAEIWKRVGQQQDTSSPSTSHRCIGKARDKLLSHCHPAKPNTSHFLHVLKLYRGFESYTGRYASCLGRKEIISNRPRLTLIALSQYPSLQIHKYRPGTNNVCVI